MGLLHSEVLTRAPKAGSKAGHERLVIVPVIAPGEECSTMFLLVSDKMMHV
jgi:hypothetical protein